jgi:tRNA-dihydrouridine synthase B
VYKRRVKIGPYTLPNRWILAPMAAVSEMPFRRIALELGAGLAPTELVSAQGLIRLSARTLRYLRHDATIENPYPVQIFGGEVEAMAQAACVAKTHGAQIIDINMGCPVPKVTRNSAGSALLCDPPRAGAIVRAIREQSGLPVTVKIRSGWDAKQVNCVQVAEELERAGASAVALHARTRAQGYSGKADWTLIAAVKRAVSIPVIGNGDVTSVARAHQMLDETGCDAVMIGRGALGYPWIFRELNGGPVPTPAERAALVTRHFDEHLAFVAGDREPRRGEPLAADVESKLQERAGVHSFRRHLGWYTHGLRGASAFRATVNRYDAAAEVREAIARFFRDAELDQTPQGEAELDYRAAYG